MLSDEVSAACYSFSPLMYTVNLARKFWAATWKLFPCDMQFRMLSDEVSAACYSFSPLMYTVNLVRKSDF
jgi:hypothetical protein